MKRDNAKFNRRQWSQQTRLQKILFMENSILSMETLRTACRDYENMYYVQVPPVDQRNERKEFFSANKSSILSCASLLPRNPFGFKSIV